MAIRWFVDQSPLAAKLLGIAYQSLMAQMTDRRIRHLPVVDSRGALTGIVSIGDLVKSQIAQLEFERDQLEGYVSG